MVGEDGFEPSKHDATDLQSAPFGHSGILPYWSWWTDLNPRPADYKSAALPTELHQRLHPFIATDIILAYQQTDVNRFFDKIFQCTGKERGDLFLRNTHFIYIAGRPALEKSAPAARRLSWILLGEVGAPPQGMPCSLWAALARAIRARIAPPPGAALARPSIRGFPVL